MIIILHGTYPFLYDVVCRYYGSQPRYKDIWALCDRLHNELMKSEVSGLVVELDVHHYEGVDLWLTQAVSRRIVPTQIPIASA